LDSAATVSGGPCLFEVSNKGARASPREYVHKVVSLWTQAVCECAWPPTRWQLARCVHGTVLKVYRGGGRQCSQGQSGSFTRWCSAIQFRHTTSTNSPTRPRARFTSVRIANK